MLQARRRVARIQRRAHARAESPRRREGRGAQSDRRAVSHVILFNIVLGLLPTFVLAGSIAAGIDDDRAHRRTFIFVYGLWAITLSMWNWMSSAHIAWIVVWGVAGGDGVAVGFVVRSNCPA